MQNFYKGKIYLLGNPLWDRMSLKKIGVSDDVEKRIKSLSTGLPDDITILYESNTLIDKFFYEYMISVILYKYRYRNDREFYNIDVEDFKIIIQTIETINKLYNTEELLLNFIKLYNYDYYKKRFNNLIEKKKIKKGIYICTE